MLFNTIRTGLFTMVKLLQHACHIIRVFRPSLEHVIDTSEALTSDQKTACKALLDTILAVCPLFEAVYNAS